MLTAGGDLYVGAVFYGVTDLDHSQSYSDNRDVMTSRGFYDGLVLHLGAAGGNYLSAWQVGGPGGDNSQVIGVYNGKLYSAGRFEQKAQFPDAGMLTSFGSDDIYLLGMDLPLPVASPLLAVALAADPIATTLQELQLQPLVSEATRRWKATGADVSALAGIDIRIADLGGTTLGLASGNTIWLDDNAAGWGWFVDSTPGNSSEFSRAGNQGERNRMDLLTVVMHEMGHLLGQEHDDEGVMAETLATGVRRSGISSAQSALLDQVFSELDAPQTASLLDGLLDERLNSRRPWLKRRR